MLPDHYCRRLWKRHQQNFRESEYHSQNLSTTRSRHEAAAKPQWYVHGCRTLHATPYFLLSIVSNSSEELQGFTWCLTDCTYPNIFNSMRPAPCPCRRCLPHHSLTELQAAICKLQSVERALNTPVDIGDRLGSYIAILGGVTAGTFPLTFMIDGQPVGQTQQVNLQLGPPRLKPHGVRVPRLAIFPGHCSCRQQYHSHSEVGW